MQMYGFLPGLILFSLTLLVGCTPYIRSPTELTPVAAPAIPVESPNLVRDVAVVETIEIRLLESDPVQVQVVASGYLPDGCTTIAERSVEQQGNTFQVTITTQRPAEAMCAQVIISFEEIIPLETAELPAGEYTVEVNGVTESFTLPG